MRLIASSVAGKRLFAIAERGNLKPAGLEDIDKLTPDMGHARYLVHLALFVQPVEAGIAIRMHPALELGEVVGRVLALAIRAELIPRGGRTVAAPWAFIANVSPYPRRRAFALCLHFDCGVIHCPAGE